MIDVKELRGTIATSAEQGATMVAMRNEKANELLDRLEVAERERDELKRRINGEVNSHGNTVDQRDHAEEMADKLSAAITGITGQDIGEHSSANCPWSNAVEHAEEYENERDALAAHVEAVADALGFPPHNDNRRRTSVVVTNIENACRFADYLHAIEQEFLMVPGEPDDDFPDEEPADECLVTSWGAKSRDHYVEQFRSALARRDLLKQAEIIEAHAEELGMAGRGYADCLAARLRHQAEEKPE